MSLAPTSLVPSTPVVREDLLPVMARLAREIAKVSGDGQQGVRLIRGLHNPARYLPASEEIEIREELAARTRPEDALKIGNDNDWLRNNLVLMGSGVHEGCHVAESPKAVANWQQDAKTRFLRIWRNDPKRVQFALTSMILLEESRIEAVRWSRLSDIHKVALRAAMLELIVLDSQDGSGHTDLPRLLLLISARLDARSLDPQDPTVQRLTKALQRECEAEGVQFGRAQAIWRDAQSRSSRDLHYPARDWADLWQAYNERQPDDPGDEPGGRGNGVMRILEDLKRSTTERRITGPSDDERRALQEAVSTDREHRSIARAKRLRRERALRSKWG